MANRRKSITDIERQANRIANTASPERIARVMAIKDRYVGNINKMKSQQKLIDESRKYYLKDFAMDMRARFKRRGIKVARSTYMGNNGG